MRVVTSALLVLAASMMATPASAQAGFADGGSAAFRCGGGTTNAACFLAELGNCADPNPRIAIPACTRQLAAQDSRIIPSNIRRIRALRYTLRGLAYAKQFDIDGAIADFDRAIKADRGFAAIHALQASALFAAGEEIDALQSINEAVGLAPDDANILNARARLLSTALDENVRDGRQAIADARRAMALQPGQPAYVAALATAYAEIGDFETAVATQQRAIDMLNPSDTEATYAYRERLYLYREGRPFRREMIVCGADADPSGPSDAARSGVFAPVVFCVGGAA